MPLGMHVTNLKSSIMLVMSNLTYKQLNCGKLSVCGANNGFCDYAGAGGRDLTSFPHVESRLGWGSNRLWKLSNFHNRRP